VLPGLRPRELRHRRGDPGRRRPHPQPPLTKRLSPGRLAGSGLILLAVVVAFSWVWPSNDFLLLPDKARPVAPLVEVKGGKDPTGPGGIYFDAIVIRRAKLFERLFPWIHTGASLVNEDQINPPGVNDTQRHAEDLREMTRSQDVAGAVALKYLGYHVILRPTGALVTDVLPGSPAEKAHLEPTDVIVGVDGHPVRKRSELRPLIERHRPGETVLLSVRSPKGLRQFRVGTVANANNGGKAAIGIFAEQASQVKLPFPVKIDAGSIGGPSAGLAFALEVVEELGHDIDRGYRVAATGEINLDGSVSPIGGVRQKIFGVREAKVDVFLVPAGDNAKEARKHAGAVRVIPVESFRQALHALATLPAKR
jgi:PDZ domain-containing protein